MNCKNCGHEMRKNRFGFYHTLGSCSKQVDKHDLISGICGCTNPEPEKEAV